MHYGRAIFAHYALGVECFARLQHGDRGERASVEPFQRTSCTSGTGTNVLQRVLNRRHTRDGKHQPIPHLARKLHSSWTEAGHEHGDARLERVEVELTHQELDGAVQPRYV